MKYKTEKIFVGENGATFKVGNEVSIRYPNGGGCGCVTITKITDTGFHYCVGGRRDKSIQYKDIAEIY